MELKVTVDLDDCNIYDYYDEGSFTLSDLIQQEIIKKVVSKIKELILDKYYDKIQEAVEKKISEMTEKILEDFKNSDEKFIYRPKRYEDPVETTFKEFVTKYFTESVERSHVSENIERFVKKCVEELKNRYDLAFASLIVKNMKEQKLLADDRLAELIK